MNKLLWASMAILSLLISACGAKATEPTASAEDIQLTSVASAFTIVAETQAALPTNTQIPPTDTLVPTPLPTDTPIPSPTFDPLEATPTLVPSLTPQTSSTGDDPCNQPLTSWQGPSTSIALAYDYTPQSKNDNVVISLWVKTDLGECGFLYDISTGPVGQYTAVAYINGKNDFKVFGGFRLSEGSWKLVIRNDSIIALGGCYPNC